MSTAVASNAIRHFHDARALPAHDRARAYDDVPSSGSLGRGLLFALPISGLLWVGIIAAFRAIF